MHGFYHDDSASFLVLKIGKAHVVSDVMITSELILVAAVRPFKCYLEQYCQDHSAKEAILCFLIVVSKELNLS